MINYANQGATRNLPLSDRLTGAMGFLGDMGVTMKVFSGGQPEKGSGKPRVGSTRHDHGHAADVFFYKDGRRLDWANPDDLPIFQEIVRQGRANGLTGFGAGEGYMQPGSMHIGFGNEAVWGADGKGANAPDWLREAYYGAPQGTAAPAQPMMQEQVSTMNTAQQQPQKSGSLWDMIPGVAKRVGLDDPDRRARIAMALDGMTLNPNPGLQKGLQAGIDRRADDRKANKTAAWLRSQGREDLAAAVEQGLVSGQGAFRVMHDAANGPTVGAQQILEDGTIIQSTSAGPRVYSPTGEVVTGQAAADAIASANAARVANETAVYAGRRAGTNTAEAATGADAAAAGARGEQSVKLGGEFFNQYQAVESSLSAIDRALTALDNGAQSGIVANQLADVTAASGELRAAMNTMGLSVVAGTTFGALSEAELRLALETAVPQNLSPPELRKWLTDRRAAQQKAADELARAAVFFNGGGTIDEYIQKYGGTKAGGISTTTLPPAGSTDSVLTDEDRAWLGSGNG